jgi:hypothetical protein
MEHNIQKLQDIVNPPLSLCVYLTLWQCWLRVCWLEAGWIREVCRAWSEGGTLLNVPVRRLPQLVRALEVGSWDGGSARSTECGTCWRRRVRVFRSVECRFGGSGGRLGNEIVDRLLLRRGSAAARHSKQRSRGQRTVMYGCMQTERQRRES